MLESTVFIPAEQGKKTGDENGKSIPVISPIIIEMLVFSLAIAGRGVNGESDVIILEEPFACKSLSASTPPLHLKIKLAYNCH